MSRSVISSNVKKNENFTKINEFSKGNITNLQIVVADKYILSKPLGTGSFGTTYFGIDKTLPVGHPDKIVAIKLEDRSNAIQLIKVEGKLYKYLYKEGVGIPKLYWFGEQDDFNVLIIEVLGRDLEYLLNTCNRKFSLKTTCIIAQEMIRIIQYLHSKGIIHRDIKPENFLIGLHNNKIHVIDFGLCKTYKDLTGNHIPFSKNKKLIGTIRYISSNCHDGVELSRRDDMESIGYLLIYFIKGTLPWQGMGSKQGYTKEEKYQMIADCKQQISTETLCEGLPKEFKTYMDHVKNLKFDEKPNYKMLYQLFNNLFSQNGYEYDGIYDWTRHKQ